MKNFDFYIKTNDSFIAVEKNKATNRVINMWIGIDDNYNNKILKTLNKTQVNTLIDELKRLSNDMEFETTNNDKKCLLLKPNCPMIDKENNCYIKHDCESQNTNY